MIHEKKLAYIVGKFPTLSETFVINEVMGIQQYGHNVLILSLCKSSSLNSTHHQYAKELHKQTVYVLDAMPLGMIKSILYFLIASPLKVLRFYKQYRKLLENPQGKRLPRLLVVLYCAHMIKKFTAQHIHSHFAWYPTDIAMLVSAFLNVPFSFTAHASDIFHPNPGTIPLEKKIATARFVVTCCEYNKRYLENTYPVSKDIFTVYHGIDLQKFKKVEAQTSIEPFMILSVGRLIEVKGFPHLIDACRILHERGHNINCLIVGEGPERRNLEEKIQQHNLQDVVFLKGAYPQEELLKIYAQSDLFVLPAESDRHYGIPNVLVEAIAMGIPTVTTALPAVTELIQHGENGLIVLSNKPEELANTMEILINNSQMREKIANSSRQSLIQKFDLSKNVELLAKIFSQNIAPHE